MDKTKITANRVWNGKFAMFGLDPSTTYFLCVYKAGLIIRQISLKIGLYFNYFYIYGN